MRQSNRISNIVTGTDGWEIFNKARQMKDRGIDVVELTVGQHDIATDSIILEAMHRSAMSGNTGYAVLPGTKELRDKVAARVQAQSNVPTTRDNVLITPGGQAALFAAHVATLDEGDRALFIDPYYATYPGTIRAAGGIPVPINAFAQNGFEPTRSDLVAGVENATTLLINSPNNPTGAVYGQDTHDMIAKVAHDHDLWLISDEVYESQIWNEGHISARSSIARVERTLLVSSMSKTFAMTGSRIGWLVAPPDVIENAIDLTTHTTYGVAGFVQDAAAFALGLGADFEAGLAAPFKRRLGLALGLLAKQNIVHAVASAATMYIMLDIRATGLSGDAFADALLEKHHIGVMPGESFGAQAAGHVRVAMTIDDARFEAAFATLLKFAGELADD